MNFDFQSLLKNATKFKMDIDHSNNSEENVVICDMILDKVWKSEKELLFHTLFYRFCIKLLYLVSVGGATCMKYNISLGRSYLTMTISIVGVYTPSTLFHFKY